MHYVNSLVMTVLILWLGGKKKNAMILLVAGAASGVIGAIQIVPFL